MIDYQKHVLSNGLKVLVHRDPTTPLAALNIVYDVGSRDEAPEKTGFAHLFEHLMFGGSKNIPNYDTPLQQVGGDNNAFTTNDITNYYLTVPAANIETGFWLESDRMLELDFSEQSLDVQRNVVIEEFKQRNLNQPYGDAFALVRELAYKVHPYRWQTIGKEIAHIEQASLDDVKNFFFTHYAPNNAVLSVTGNVDVVRMFALAEKWFGDLPRRNVPVRNLPQEPLQTAPREMTVYRDVPYDAVYMAFHMDAKLGPDFYATDLISDVLSNGDSSRLYRRLLVEKALFSEIDAYISGDNDPGLFVVAGKLTEGVPAELGIRAVWDELEQMKVPIAPSELQKVINKVEANWVYSEMSFLSKAMNLGAFELLGDANLVNTQPDHYREVTCEKMALVANSLFRHEGCSILKYLSKK